MNEFTLFDFRSETLYLGDFISLFAQKVHTNLSFYDSPLD